MYIETYNNSNFLQRWLLRNVPADQLFLRWLGKYINLPGGGIGKPSSWPESYHNRFVFTCKYGWIDMGHFFNTAWIGYQLQRKSLPGWATDWIPIKGWEMLQNAHLHSPFKNILASNGQSAYTTEDWYSNALGTQFGRAIASERRFADIGDIVFGTVDTEHDKRLIETLYIAEKWKEFLIKSGAVQYDEDDWVHKELQKDVLENHWIKNDVPWDNPTMEDEHPIFNDRYRVIWDKIRCESYPYRLLCCCTEQPSICFDKCDSGECSEQPLIPYYQFPRLPGAIPLTF